MKAKIFRPSRFKVLEKNSNKAGIAHGGTHIAFADGIMGYTAWKTQL